MACSPLSVTLEVDPSTAQRILLTLDKTCDPDDQATWKLSFELMEGNPLATVVKLNVEIDPSRRGHGEKRTG
jgi:hypothetical protein